MNTAFVAVHFRVTVTTDNRLMTRRSPTMTAVSRRTVHITRTEHALPLPASLLDVVDLLDTVRAELTRADRPVDDAELRVVEGELLAFYDVPRAAVVTR
ncbi:hypothetical protein ACF1BU_14215 [Streptomyces sp. NPDC014724]|uniref:hypothetical protein n=1 Tax=unclassified Streptomyces TaxID=2593676 RepID=UPI0036F92148